MTSIWSVKKTDVINIVVKAIVKNKVAVCCMLAASAVIGRQPMVAQASAVAVPVSLLSTESYPTVTAAQEAEQKMPAVQTAAKLETELDGYVRQLVQMRCNVLLSGEVEQLESIYDTHTQYGVWALSHEIQKMNYIRNWENKQGVDFLDINPIVQIRRIKCEGEKASVVFICSTAYRYAYRNDTTHINTSRIGTEHYMRLIKKDGVWMISMEWYKDPFADSMNLDTGKDLSITEFIGTQQARNLETIGPRRKAAMEYAEKYCGIASEEKYGYQYNSKYMNFNAKGGDCANFGSQILHEGGKFKRTAHWNYDRGGATRAWVNADGFKNFMISSGRASLISSGGYKKVVKASYRLLPGDFVAYGKKGDIVHISVVTGADTKGYSLVSCHNTDRNNVPWDLGWSDKNIYFWLVRVHF